MREAWPTPFGPLLGIYLGQAARARRGAFHATRTVFGLLAGAGVGTVWLVAGGELQGQPAAEAATSQAQACFTALLFLVVSMAVWLPPALAAVPFATGRRRQTLDVFLTTPLRDREIILTFWVVAVLAEASYLLVCLPILAGLLTLGGIEPDLLWCGFLAAAVTLAALNALGLLVSVYSRDEWSAVLRTYLICGAYLAGWGLLAGLRHLLAPPAWAPPGTPVPAVAEGLDAVADWYNAGNLYAALIDLIVTFRQRGHLGGRPWELLGWYALFHGLGTAACLGWAIRAVRRVVPRPSRAPRRRWRPALDGWPPLLWKELFHDPTLNLGRFAVPAFLTLAAVSLLPVLFYLKDLLDAALYPSPGWNHPGDRFRATWPVYARFVSGLLGPWLVAAVGVRTATNLAAEGDRRTLDGLLTTPLTLPAILLSKAAGALAAGRWVAALLAGTWILTAALGAVPWAVVGLMALGLAAEGLVAALLGLGVAASGCPPAAAFNRITGLLFVWLLPSVFLGIREPAATFLVAYPLLGFGATIPLFGMGEAVPLAETLIRGGVGVGLNLLAAAGLYRWALTRFARRCGRSPAVR